MKKIVISIIFINLFIITSNLTITSAKNITSTEQSDTIYNITMKQDLLCLMMAYPEYVSTVESENGYVYLLMKSGRKLIYDDKKEKSFEEKLANPDLQDMLEQIYPLSPTRNLMDKNFDPGRSRVYRLLTEVYGTSKQSVESKLVTVNLRYGKYQFNSNNKAAIALQSVMKELVPLTEKKQNIRSCVFPCSGTYNYRLIAGTNRLSPHSFGIAIDLARDKRDYWKWASKEEGQKRLSTYSTEVVEVFEKNNFIWGGKWGHFDILHFEYRPEIILKARYFFQDKQYSSKPWYEGVPIEEVFIQELMEKINKTLK